MKKLIFYYHCQCALRINPGEKGLLALLRGGRNDGKSYVRTLLLIFWCTLSGNQIAAAAKQVVAGPESTVYGIAYEHGILTHALISANNLKPPYTLHPGQVLTIPSPNEHIVGQGETLKDIADEHGVNVDVLAQENERPAIRPGDHLILPSRDTVPMAEALQPPPDDNITTSSLDPLPMVKTGPVRTPSLPSSTATAPQALPQELADEIAREKGVIKGESRDKENRAKPMLMGNLTQKNAGAPTAATTSLKAEENFKENPTKKIKKESPKKEKPIDKKPVDKKAPLPEIDKTKEVKQIAEKKETATPKQPQFMWPVEIHSIEKDVTSKFKAGKNDGIKINIPEGTKVKAAAGGEVLYAGNELKNFGNLLLLKHDEGWVTAYAHNSSLLVKKGDKVKQGQVIAKSGKTGDIKQPQLHFEIRKGKQPIDPLQQLGS